MTLLNLIEHFSQLDSEHTIFVKLPWGPAADAITVSTITDSRSELPTEKELQGYHYFIKVGAARDFADDWSKTLTFPPSGKQLCERLIQYATDDA